MSESTVSKDSTLPAPAEVAALPDMNAVSMRRFFIAATLTAVLMISFAWVWAVHGRMWFLDPEYPMWRAKMQMLDSCTVGETAILGDSRPMAGLIPAKISDTTVNLSLGGATSIESLRVVQDMLKCPKPPKRVIFAFLPFYVMIVQSYWERSAPFYLTFDEMEAVRKTELRLHKHLIYSTNRFESSLEMIKNFSYSISLPTYFFPAMVNAGFIGRKERNEIELQATLRNRGQHFFGSAERSDWLAPETYLSKFEPNRILDLYFENILALLRQHGIKVYFVGAPLNEVSRAALPPKVESDFVTYLKDVEARDPNFRVLGNPLPSLPNDNFGDVEHVNERGADAWSKSVGELLKGAIAQEQSASAQR